MADATKFSAPFIEMASRIERNTEKEFGGAMLIVDPEGNVVDFTLVGSKPDKEQFWGTAMAKVQNAASAANGTNEAWGGGFRR